jgi:hypothetical protein
LGLKALCIRAQCFFLLLNIVMADFVPDIDYVIDMIADHYVAIGTALESGDLTLAQRHETQLTLLVDHLRRYVHTGTL